MPHWPLMTRRDEPEAEGRLALYGVAGLERQPGVVGTRPIESGRRSRPDRFSESISLVDVSTGASITVTSHRKGDDESYAQVRRSAFLTAYFATPSGQARLASRSKGKPLPEPPDMPWTLVTIPVGDQETAFEICDLGGGIWAAFGQLPSVDVTMTSRGVPPGAVHLQPVSRSVREVPAMPDLADNGEAVSRDLEARVDRIAHLRLRRRQDYWALRCVEIDHIRRLAHKYELSATDRELLEHHWLGRINAKLAPTLDRFEERQLQSISSARMRHQLRWNFLFQLWFNTIGPGGRTWFGNRYAALRHFTFRLHWRP